MCTLRLLINKSLNADEVNSGPECCSQPRINIKKRGEARFLTLINMNISTQCTQTLMASSRYNQHHPTYTSRVSMCSFLALIVKFRILLNRNGIVQYASQEWKRSKTKQALHHTMMQRFWSLHHRSQNFVFRSLGLFLFGFWTLSFNTNQFLELNQLNWKHSVIQEFITPWPQHHNLLLLPSS